MRLYLLLLSFFFTCTNGFSQFSLALQVPPTGVLLKSQLWNFTVINPFGPTDVKINLVLRNTATDQIVLTGISGVFNVKSGTQHVGASDITIQYEYPSDFLTDRRSDGLLSVGAFEACYTLQDGLAFHKSDLANECTDVIVEPLSPPVLNTPCNGCSADQTSPMFTWLPPGPINLFSNLTYEMKLVEVLPGQASSEAIQYNAPVLIIDENKSPFLNYPASGTSLDTSKTYAWQVVAKNNSQPAAQSEIWVFNFDRPKALVQKDTGVYILLKPDNAMTGRAGIDGDVLRIRYYSFSKFSASFIIKNSSGDPLKRIRQDVAYGQNLFTFHLPSSVKRGETYTIELTDPGNKKNIIHFTKL